MSAAATTDGGGEEPSELERELVILKKIEHPHIVRLYEVMDDPQHDIVYLVLELLRQGALLCTHPPQVQAQAHSTTADVVAPCTTGNTGCLAPSCATYEQ